MKLSNNLKVAFEIYRAEINNEQVWLSKLADNLEMNIRVVANCLDYLEESDIVLGGYDYIDDTHIKRMFIIHDGAFSRIKELYDEYCKQN